jgi:hypothetical protein
MRNPGLSLGEGHQPASMQDLAQLPLSNAAAKAGADKLVAAGDGVEKTTGPCDVSGLFIGTGLCHFAMLPGHEL